MSPEEREAFLATPRVSIVSIPSDDDRPPLTVPVWYAYEPGGNLRFFTGIGGHRARKARLLEKAGRLSLSVQHPEPPYRFVTVEGTVVDEARPPSVEAMLAVLSRYLPPEMAEGMARQEVGRTEGNELVLFTIRPDRWLTGTFDDAC